MEPESRLSTDGVEERNDYCRVKVEGSPTRRLLNLYLLVFKCPIQSTKTNKQTLNISLIPSPLRTLQGIQRFILFRPRDHSGSLGGG